MTQLTPNITRNMRIKLKARRSRIWYTGKWYKGLRKLELEMPRVELMKILVRNNLPFRK